MPTKFFAHQQKIIDEDPKKTGLWLGTGSGKTRTALALARGKTLIVCPKTQRLDRNWEREVEKMRKAGIKLKITKDTMFSGALDKLKEGHGMPTVISKETFRQMYMKHEELDGFYNTIIIDEAETCLGVTPYTRQRNKQIIPKTSQLFEALQYFVETYNPDRIYLCTATITRTPMTVWAAGKILGRKWDWKEWRDAFYFQLPMPGRTIYSPIVSEECKDRLARNVRKIGYVGRLEEWFDVPDQIYREEHVELTTAQQKRIRELPLEFPDPIVRLGKQLQVENGVLKGDEFNPAETFPNQKLEKILSYAEEFPKMIIWAKYSAQIKLYEQELLSKGYTVYTLTGQTKDRGLLLEELAKQDRAILIAQVYISAGWEWKECGVSIFASRSYSISDYEQALGRVQRTDAIKKNLYINLIARSKVDLALNDTLANKKDFSERIYYENTK